jgi:hypothetical protein
MAFLKGPDPVTIAGKPEHSAGPLFPVPIAEVLLFDIP